MHENTTYTTILTTIITSPMPHNTSTPEFWSSRSDKVSLIVILSLLGAIVLCTCFAGACCRSGGPSRPREAEGIEMRTLPARTMPPPLTDVQRASASASAIAAVPPVTVKCLSSENESIRSARTEDWVEMQRSESDERLKQGGADKGRGERGEEIYGGDLGEGPIQPWSPI